MSDTSGGESGGVSKKKSFSSRFSSKLHNPFKRGGTSDSSSDDDAEKSPSRVTRKKTVKAAVAHLIPPIPGKLSSSPARTKVPAAKPTSLQHEAHNVIPVATAVQPSLAPPAAPSAASAAATAARPAVPGAPVGAAAPGAAATEAAGPVAKRREVVGGSVYGVAEIVLTGVKGDPDEVMKTLRSRGFVIHLVRR